MATLQIEFNCLCLFARDEDAKVVHVLMPSTADHGAHGGGHAAHDHAGGQHVPAQQSEAPFPKHVIRLYHKTKFPDGLPLEGWSLAFRPEPASGSATTEIPATPDAEVVDLTAVTNAQGDGGVTVDRGLLQGPHEKVVSRITLHAGKFLNPAAEIEWKFGNRRVRMAHKGTWQIDDVDELTWQRIGATGSIPFTRVSDLGDPEDVDGKEVYRVRLFHTTQNGLPPNNGPGPVDPPHVKHHFKAFYTMMGYLNTKPSELPEVADKPFARTVNCGMAQALVAPPAQDAP